MRVGSSGAPEMKRSGQRQALPPDTSNEGQLMLIYLKLFSICYRPLPDKTSKSQTEIESVRRTTESVNPRVCKLH